MPLGNSNKVAKFSLPDDGGSTDARYDVGATALTNGLSDISRLENVFGEFIENSLDVNSYDLPSLGYYYFLLNAKLNQCIDKLDDLEGNNTNTDLNLAGVANKGIIKILPRDFIPSDSSSTYNVAVYDYNNTSFGIRAMSSTQDLYAFIDLPMGYTATTITLNCYHKMAIHTSACEIFEGKLDDSSGVNITNVVGGIVTLTSGSGGAFSQSINITDTAATNSNYICIKIDPNSTFRFYGGTVAITFTG